MEKHWEMFVIDVKKNLLENMTIKKFKKQSKLTFNGFHKSFTSYDSYTFKQKEVLMDKPFHLRYSILELSKLRMYDTYYDNLQQYFGQDKLKLQILICDKLIITY